jgi:FAD synthase
MSLDVVLKDIDVNETLQLVRELKDQGLVVGKDFDFAYHQAKWDNFSYEAVNNKHVKFTFYDQELGMIYLLRWS